MSPARGRTLGTVALAMGGVQLLCNAALAVSCPTGGAKVAVTVTRSAASTSQTIATTISGTLLGSYATCTNKSSSYSATCTIAAGNTSSGTCLVGNLNSGVWVHKVSYTDGTLTVTQQQRGEVVWTNPSPTPPAVASPPVVQWKHYTRSIAVNKTGDSGSETCNINAASPATSCGIRGAVAKAETEASSADPLLIQVGVSPGTLSNSLSITRAGNKALVIDGVDINGDPWLVGDANRNVAPSFNRVLQFPDGGNFQINSNDVTLRGLSIKGVASTTNPPVSVIEATLNVKGLIIEHSLVDAGMAQNCASMPNYCNSAEDALRIRGHTGDPVSSSVTVRNSEVRAGVDQGIELGEFAGSDYGTSVRALIENSWIHHNYKGNIRAMDPTTVSLKNSTVERAGARASDNAVMQNFANGIYFGRSEPILPGQSTPSASSLDTEGSVFRNNTFFGMIAAGTASTYLPKNDYFCGNGSSGLYAADDTFLGYSPGDPLVNSRGGIAASYNGDTSIFLGSGYGAAVQPTTSGSYNLSSSSAFVSNRQCGLLNGYSGVTVQATDNQWAGTQSGGHYADECAAAGGGPINLGTVQSPTADAAAGWTITTAAPQRAIAASQTIRVFGDKLNAVEGNPAPSGSPLCTLGLGSNSCCTDTRRNTCATLTGNCLQFQDSTATWINMDVLGVTPRMLEAKLPAQFSCIGGSESVRTSKKNSLGNPITSSSIPFCTGL